MNDGSKAIAILRTWMACLRIASKTTLSRRQDDIVVDSSPNMSSQCKESVAFAMIKVRIVPIAYRVFIFFSRLQ